MPWCTPPLEPPEPTRLRQTTAPFLSGSSAKTSPDFCPASSNSPSLGSTRITNAPKSKSGPFSFGRLAPPPRQAAFHASLASAWKTQRRAPVWRSSAMMASLVSVAGEDEFWPVPK